jgi:hypothetical protein
MWTTWGRSVDIATNVATLLILKYHDSIFSQAFCEYIGLRKPNKYSVYF